MNQAIFDRLYASVGEGRARTISPTVITQKLELPPISEELRQQWIDVVLDQNPIFVTGDVLGTSMRMPGDFATVLDKWQAQYGFTAQDTKVRSELFSCLGCAYHHDLHYPEYRDAAFAVLWLENETAWDLVFPLSGQRIALEAGLVVLFDSGNVHGVVKRGAPAYDIADFDDIGFQMFFSRDYQYASANVRRCMGVRHLTADEQSRRIQMPTGSRFDDFVDPMTGVLKQPALEEPGLIAA